MDVLATLRSGLADRYAIERELGQGGMATVYLARDLKHDRRVALKVLRPELAASLGLDRFLLEIKTTAQLAHPHILPLLDSGGTGEQGHGGTGEILYYVMPYVEGESLRDRLTREKQLPLDDALQLTREVADALSYAHSHGVVHRDIKPENILLESGHAVVADFGIAKAIAAAGSERLTETGLSIGTPAYMSPEQAAGSQDLDGRSDLYSLGCVLYEMLAGQPPFTGATADSVVRQHLTTEPPRITVVRPAVPEPIATALHRALAKTPADRFVTAADFAAVLAHPEAMSTPMTVPKRRWWRRRAVALAAAAAVCAVAAIAAVLLVRGRGPALDPTIVVVAPFENHIRDTSLAQLGTITADWVTQVLQGTGEIKVVPTAAVLATGWAPGADPRALAATTGAGTVITGRASLQGDSVYLRADVVNARTGALLHSVPPVAATIRQPLVAVTELARRVGGATANILDPQGLGWSRLPPPTSYEAYQALAEGFRRFTDGDWKRAWEGFQQAYALDTTLVRALLSAVVAHRNGGDQAGLDPLLHFLPPRRGRLTRADATRLDMILANEAGDIQRMLEAAREGAPLLPPRQGVYVWGWAAVNANRPAEAIHAFTEADPGYRVERDWPLGSWYLAAAYHLLGRHREELKAARDGRRAFPRSPVPVSAEVRALAALGRDDDVFRLLDEASRMEPVPHVFVDGRGGWPWLAYEAALEFRAHGRPEAYRRAIQLVLDATSEVRTGDTAAVAARAQRATALYAAERWEEARAAYARLHAADSANLDFLGGLAASEARLGHRGDAEALAGRLATFDVGNSLFWRARIAALLGERDRTVALLREAFARGAVCAVVDGGARDDCHREMDFESLRGYAPFDELLRPKG